MKKITLLLFILIAGIGSAQELTLTQGGFLSIDSGALLYMNGMELKPSTNYDLTGPNSVAITNTPLSDPQSISKVVDLSSPLENYLGNISFYYQDSELNNIEASDLELAIMDVKTEWQLVNSDLDTDLKKVDYTFDTPITIYGLTASKKRTLNSSIFQDGSLQVFPNPTSSILNINYSSELDIEIFSVLGSSLMNTTGNKIDLSGLSTGTYLVKLSDPQTNNTIFKKIIKN